MASRSLGALNFPFHEGTHVGNLVTEGIGGTSSSTSSYTYIWSIRACKSYTSSSNSMVMALPFSSIDILPNHGFLGDMRTGPIVYLSFFSRGVRGDFGTSSETTTSLGSLAVSSANFTPVLATAIMVARDMFCHILKDSKIARFSILYNFSNPKQPSVV